MVGFSVSALVLFLSACGGSPEEMQDGSELGAAEAALTDTGSKTAMIVYSPKNRVDHSEFQPLGSAESLGGRVIAGSPDLTGRIDMMGNGMMAGIFKATTGRVEILFPFTEHGTILEGEVIMTDEAGQSHTFRKGDSYLVRKGQRIIWDVKGRYVVKSFFNTVQ